MEAFRAFQTAVRPDPFEIAEITQALVKPLEELANLCHRQSVASGFWPNEGRNKGEMIALMHSELSEMLEAVRKPQLDVHCSEHESEVVEAADLLIRLLDYARATFGLEAFIDALCAKMVFNASRPPKHGKAF